MVRVESEATAATLASLNRHVHDWHVKAYPKVSKDIDDVGMEHYFESSLRKPGYYHYVACVEGQAIGFVQAEVRVTGETSFRRPQTVVFVHIIVVRPDYRGRGVGRMLMEKVFDLAAQNGISRVELDHWAGNESASRFFSQSGFKAYRQFMCLERE